MNDETPMVISCHPDAYAIYDEMPNGTHRCTLCKSMHPQQFMEGLRSHKLVSGWHWAEHAPIWCEMDNGRFFAVHMMDMPMQWLKENAITIFAHTGVLFYWEKEQLTSLAPAPDIVYTAEEPAYAPPHVLQKAQAFLKSVYREADI